MSHAQTSVDSVGRPVASLAALFAAGAPLPSHQAWQRMLTRQLAWPVSVVMVLIVLWVSWAPLSGAVVASGQVQTEFGRKVVQHQEGGIVRDILVRPGQTVRRGQAVMVVGDVRSDAAADLLSKQLLAEQLRAHRARAEFDLAGGVPWPSGAPPELVARESQLFDARRQALSAQIAAIQAQMSDARAQVSALNAQLSASERASSLAAQELAMHGQLAESGFIQKTRLVAMERAQADMQGRVEGIRGQMAEARVQLNVMAQSMAQARAAYQQRAGDELKDTAVRIRDIEERLRPTQDQQARQTVRAPVDGQVMSVRVAAPGTVVGPREPLLEIVPDHESLVIELKVDPHDIDHVRAGGAADVRLSAFDARQTRLLKASVQSVSPDAVTDPLTHQPWYTARVMVSPDELQRHQGMHLTPGMPAEVFVTTPPRTLLQYLLEPLGVFARRAMREP